MYLRQFILLVCAVVSPAILPAHDFYFYTTIGTPAQVVPMVAEPLPGAGAEVEMRFDGDAHNGGPFAFYSVRLQGLDLDGQQTPTTNDDVLAIRFRMGAMGENGPHALNVFAAANSAFRQDDADLVVTAAAGLVEGIWNIQDQTFSGTSGTRLETDSVDVLDAEQPLIEGNLYVEVLTTGNPGGLLRGQLHGAASTKTARYFDTGDFQLTLFSTSPRQILIERTTDWTQWQQFTNRVAGVEVVRVVDPVGTEPSMAFYRVTETSLLFPTISQQPENTSVASAGTAIFDVLADGTPPFYPQWFHNGQPVQNASDLQLVLSDINASNEGSYYVVVSNLVGSATSQSATLSIQP